MYDFHRHQIRNTSLLDPKLDHLEIRVEEIKQAINERIDEMARIRGSLPIPPHLCYFTTRETTVQGVDPGPGPRPPPKLGETVIVLEDHPEYMPYFKAVFAYEHACAALKTANRRFQKSLEKPTKKREKTQK